MTASAFRGWPAEALAWFEGLEADNSKTWFTAHRQTYDAAVRGPLEALAAAVHDEFGPAKVFRPYRDVRFSHDKSPYKDHAAAVIGGDPGPTFYVQLSADGLLAGSGAYQLDPPGLARYRRAVDQAESGEALAAIVAALEAAGLTVGGEALKSAPRGFTADHARGRLLRHRGLYVSRHWPPARWLHQRAALDRVVGLWRAASPLNAWLDAHVVAR